jgi:hypothetical protein
LTPGVTSLLRQEISTIIPLAMEDAQDWSAVKKIRGISVMTSYFLYAPSAFPPVMTHRFILQLAIARQTEEQPAAKLVKFL